MADVAFYICVAIQMIEVGTAGLAGMMDLIVAVNRDKTVAFKLLALAYYASAAARYHRPIVVLAGCNNNLFYAWDCQLDVRR